MDDDSAGEAPVAGTPSTPGVMDRLQLVCDDAVRELSAFGVGVSVMAENGVHGMAASSDEVTERIEEMQFTVGEGPSIDAFAASRPVLVSDLADAVSRWPIYAPAAQDAGAGCVFAFPLQIGAARLRVLDVFRDQAGPLSTGDLGQAFTFADRAVNTLLDGQDNSTLELDALDDAIEPRAELYQAQGMVMVQLGITITEALVRIRAYAYAHNGRLNEVAADIVARKLRFDGEAG